MYPWGPEQGGVSGFVLSAGYVGVVFLLFLFYYSSLNDGERGTRCARGALAVAHGTSGGDHAHAGDPRDVRHAHELDFGDEAPDDRQDLQGCIFDISNKPVLNHPLHERVHWIY